MKVLVLSKTNFDAMMRRNSITPDNVEGVATIFISINDTASVYSVPYFHTDKQNVKVLYFDDVDCDVEVNTIDGEVKTAKAFTKKQAIELIRFLDSHKDKQLCIVHCASGISRSGAVGSFINDYYSSDTYADFKRANPQIAPNALVHRILNNTMRNKEKYKILRQLLNVKKICKKIIRGSRDVYYYLLIFFIRLLKYFGYKLSSEGIPGGVYCYSIIRIDTETGHITTKNCPHYKFMSGDNDACTYTGFIGYDCCFADQCKICNTNVN